MSIYHCTVSELQHFVSTTINIANIEGGKIPCAYTQNRKLFKMLDFHRSGHMYVSRYVDYYYFYS